MAANFWTSNHCKYLLTRESLGACHARDRALGLTDDQIRKIKSFHTLVISDLAKNLKLRQRVTGTAVHYFRRYYTRNCFVESDPRLVAQACLYLAAKAEECPVQVQRIKQYMDTRQKRVGTIGIQEFSIKEMLDYELQVLEELDFDLAVFNPYRPLVDMVKDAQLPQEMIDKAWAIMNDSYYTDLSLLHPPYMLAVGAICMAATLQGHDLNKWMSELNVDLNQVYEITMELLNLYDNFRAIVSQDECYLLLTSLKTTTAATTPPTGSQSTLGARTQ
eukprot:jgi/Tetstr1/458834/TSEL_045217.t1